MSKRVVNGKMRMAIVGGGPSALFLFKGLIARGNKDMEIDIFEKNGQLGAGMPYSTAGANNEHVTNVSDNEIPPLVTTIAQWVKTAPRQLLDKFNINPDNFNEYKVLPRLLFGHYLSAQFDMLLKSAAKSGIVCRVHYNSHITDITDKPQAGEVWVEVAGESIEKFTHVAICTGHEWPVTHEGVIDGYYDSPYPPQKLNLKLNHAIAIRGSSLTAIDAIRTLARNNGCFEKNAGGMLTYTPAQGCEGFKMIMHSRGGFLPAVRFHLNDPHLSKKSLLTNKAIAAHMAGNGGFLSLDFIFDKDFKEAIRKKDAVFYERIKGMGIEEFVTAMMDLREIPGPFQLLKAEYTEAAKSIKRREPVYWKEALAVLSFAMNYPAKHFSAEDMLRLQKVLMPLIAIVIAFVPQNPCRELLALHNAGVLHLVAVGDDGHVEVTQGAKGITYHYKQNGTQPLAVKYETFINCTGQPHLSYNQFPFKGLVQQHVVSPARIKFKNNDTGRAAYEAGTHNIERFDEAYYLRVPGISINDNFQLTNYLGAANTRIFMMAVPYIAGFNPDYSGLDFCEAASGRIIKTLFPGVPPQG